MKYTWMRPIFQNDFYYWVSNVFRIRVIVSIFRNYKISYDAQEERVQRLNDTTVSRNVFITFNQCNLFFRHYLVLKKKFYCFQKKIIVADFLFAKASLIFFFRFAQKRNTNFCCNEYLFLFSFVLFF